MKKIMKKILSLLMAGVMTVSLLPSFALKATATETVTKTVTKTPSTAVAKDITIGTSAIKGGQQSNIYFGRYQQSSLGDTVPTKGRPGEDWIESTTAVKNGQGGYYSIDPVKWRVLSASEDKAFLISDKNLDAMQYYSEWVNISWETSIIRSWLNGYSGASNAKNLDYSDDNFIDSAFTTLEKSMINETVVTNDDNPEYGTDAGNDTTDKIFLISIAEANNTEYFLNDNSRKALNTDYVYGGGRSGTEEMYQTGATDMWTLRTPGETKGKASFITYDGIISADGKSVDSILLAVRPAFNLNLSNVILTSAAEGGKTSGSDAADGTTGIFANKNYDDIEDNDGYKLTLYDDNRKNFNASLKSVSAGKAVISYSGAVTGSNEYISVIIKNGDVVKYYGRVSVASLASSEVEFSLPEDFSMADGDVLCVFNEQYNGDYKFDFASRILELRLSAMEGQNIELGASALKGGQKSNIYFGSYQQSSAGTTQPEGTENVDWVYSATADEKSQGPYYKKEAVKWNVLSVSNGKVFLLSDKNLDVVQYNTVCRNVTWKTSTIRSWLNGYPSDSNDQSVDYSDDNFMDAAFTTAEKGVIADTNVVNDDNPEYDTDGGRNTTDKIFLLSIAEATNTDYFADAGSRAALNTAYVTGGGKTGTKYMADVGKAEAWWLRSPGSDAESAASVGESNDVIYDGSSVDYESGAVRPAFNVGMSSILFTSAATGGKTNGRDAADGTTGIFENKELKDIPDNDAYKLTLLDANRDDFTASVKSFSGREAAVSYSGAVMGTNEYISVFIANDDVVKYYGRVGTVSSADGEVEITLPEDFSEENGDVLYVFNEQYNGDYKTDFASGLINVKLGYSIKFNANGGEGTMASQIITAGVATKLSANTFTKNAYTFNGWNTQADGKGTGYSDEQSVTDFAGTLYAQWKAAPAEAPVVTSSDLRLDYGSYTDKKISVAVTVQDGYNYLYQWYDSSKKLISGATESTYSIPDDLKAGSYEYYCVVKAERGDNGETATTERKITVTVDKVSLTVKAKDKAITYGEAPENNGVIYSGFVNGESETVLKGTLAYDYGYTQYGNVGTFDIIPKGLTSDNYDITFEKGTLTVEKADRSAPSGLLGTDETIDGKADGKIAGVSAEMEYRNADSESYTAISGTEITGLADGTYYIRHKSDTNHNASADTTVVLRAGRKLKVTIPETQTGYTLTANKTELDWNDSVEFTFALKDGYVKQSSFVVKVNGNKVLLDENDKYTVTGAQSDITVIIEGVADITVPDISGIENGETYYGDTTFTVTGEYLETVEVDGVAVTLTGGKYTIKADGREHSIIATAKSGKKGAMIKITVIAIASLDDTIENITLGNVKSGDKKAIEDVQSVVNALMNGEKTFTESEQAELNAMKANTEALLKKIAAVSSEMSDLAASLNAYEADKVKPDDKKALEEIIAAAASLLKEDNLTALERNKVLQLKEKAESLVNGIEDEVPPTEADNVNNEDVNNEDANNEDKNVTENMPADYNGSQSDDGKKTDVTETVTEEMNRQTTAPATGDSENISLWFALLLGAGAIFVATVCRSRRRGTEK